MSDYIERYWRDATPADAIREPPMVARFRDTSQEQWESGYLSGFDRPRSNSTERWWYSSDSAESFNFCQVYDAPDPGEGWRLIDPHKEPLREGDEFMLFFDRKRGWIHIDTEVTNWAEKNFYRRRIEPPKPKYEPFRWEDREQLRGRWIVDRTGEQEYTIDDFLNDDDVLYICGHPAEYFLNWRFLDTGEPVGRKVE